MAVEPKDDVFLLCSIMAIIVHNRQKHCTQRKSRSVMLLSKSSITRVKNTPTQFIMLEFVNSHLERHTVTHTMKKQST